MAGRRLGPARADRVNFPHHNTRAIVMPDPQRPDPDAVPAHAIVNVPWPGESGKEQRQKEWDDRAERGPVPLGERGTCPRCGRTKVRLRADGTLYDHQLPGSVTMCTWGQWLDAPAPPATD